MAGEIFIFLKKVLAHRKKRVTIKKLTSKREQHIAFLWTGMCVGLVLSYHFKSFSEKHRWRGCFAGSGENAGWVEASRGQKHHQRVAGWLLAVRKELQKRPSGCCRRFLTSAFRYFFLSTDPRRTACLQDHLLSHITSGIIGCRAFLKCFHMI